LSQHLQQPVLRLQALLQAKAAASRATATAGDPSEAWYNLSAFDAINNNSSAVERDLRFAIAAWPNWFKPHWTLARLLTLESRRQEAEREAALAATLDGGKDTEVTQTLTDIRIRLH
jgi:hypothetical protein